jgi:hypothetical protein
MSLHHPKDCNIEQYEFDQSGVIQLSYTVKLAYPSFEVLEFYDSELEKLDWQKFKHPYFDNLRKWEPVWNGSIEGMPLTHRLNSYWIDEKRKNVIVLMLEYRSYNISKRDVFNNMVPNNDNQKVILQIGAYSDLVLLPPVKSGGTGTTPLVQ